MEFKWLDMELGAIYSKDQTTFRVWASNAQNVKLVIYSVYFHEQGQQHDMNYTGDGLWQLVLMGDYKDKYYNYLVTIDGVEKETPDPYAKSASINGERGLIVDFASLNPVGWDDHPIPPPIQPTESIIYEIHVRDFSIDPCSGMKHKGKYLAFTEAGTKGVDGVSTGIDHLKELGITHVHLLPVFDFASVDERRENMYNWGYDPHLYNVPEGSYATNPYDGRVRITEFKKMVQSLHASNIRVVMDVVFNHTIFSENTPFNILAPKAYYRFDAKGDYGNGSGCGNELATERPFVRKFIIDSLKFWMREYKIDGFRFDLMALLDRDTVSEIEKQLKSINPNVLLYGEPWTGGKSVLDEKQQFRKGWQRGRQVALFNDDFRNALKGDNDGDGLGFVNGGQGLELPIKSGIAGSIRFDELIHGFAEEPGETINYVSCHDNLTLFDKIKKVCPDAAESELEQMNRLALSIVLTSQGVAFLHGGAEFLRSKQGHWNSYNMGDEINQITWNEKKQYLQTFNYIKGLIAIRKSQRVMMLSKAEDIRKCLRFVDSPPNTVAYLLNSPYEGDYSHILVVHNGNRKAIEMRIPFPGQWMVLANGQSAYQMGVYWIDADIASSVDVPALSTYILAK